MQELYELIKNYGANELRFSLKQKHCSSSKYKRRKLSFLPRISQIRLRDFRLIRLYHRLSQTDTCNLGIASSTGIAEELERVLN
jgi:sulfite reductase (ferredoxin)